MPRSLNPQQRAFCLEYVKTSNATKAAVSASYSAATAAVQGCQLLKKPLMVAEIARLRSKIAKKSELSAQVVMNELAKLVTSNVQDLFDEQGNLKPIHELPADVAATISSIEMGDKGPGIKKLKQHSKLGAIELASKLLGMIRDQQNTQASVQIILAPAPAIQQPAVSVGMLKPEWD